MKLGRFKFFEKFVVKGRESTSVYMIRWRLFECPWFGIFLHRIYRSDDDPHLHDHPWPFASLILWGGYWECLPDDRVTRRRPGTLVFHRATDMHRVSILGDRPATTLVLIGRRYRDWGFATEVGWVQWREYLKSPFCSYCGRRILPGEQRFKKYGKVRVPTGEAMPEWFCGPGQCRNSVFSTNGDHDET